MRYAIGIDIGGTKVAVGIVEGTGKLLHYTILSTDLEITPVQMIRQISLAVGELIVESGIEEEQIVGIGIGAPGPLDARRGRITCPPNMPKWLDVPIVAELSEAFSYPILLDNDANAATLAEKWIGAAQDSEHFVYLTISTGIGAGLYLDSKLISGSRGNAGDVGHVVVDPSKGTCACGQKGCLEWVASGTAIARQGSELMGTELTTQEVFELYQAGNTKITALIDDVFTAIGVGCVTLINLFDPEKIVIGGGVSQVGEPLFKEVQRYVSQYALNPSGRETQVVPASSRQDAGMIGAAALILQNQGGNIS
jgi:glucokinase